MSCMQMSLNLHNVLCNLECEIMREFLTINRLRLLRPALHHGRLISIRQVLHIKGPGHVHACSSFLRAMFHL